MNVRHKNKIGRPTVLTEEALQKLLFAFSYGSTDKEACALANISESTLYEHQAQNQDFLEEKERVKSGPILKARKAVIDSFNTNPTLALKFLERKKPDEFAISKPVHKQENIIIETSTEEKIEIQDALKKLNIF